ncbi:MAG TPA: HNH endonuclease signature motif containing protein [Polyangiaceae bacterium]
MSTRDGERCAFLSADGVRCRETRLLELHHVTPHARNGPTTADNLVLYCRAHNALAAEQDFGRAFMARRSSRDLRSPEGGGR